MDIVQSRRVDTAVNNLRQHLWHKASLVDPVKPPSFGNMDYEQEIADYNRAHEAWSERKREHEFASKIIHILYGYKPLCDHENGTRLTGNGSKWCDGCDTCVGGPDPAERSGAT